MKGVIVWEYAIPESLKEYINPGLDSDTEDSVIVEVTPRGEIVWQLKIKGRPA